MARDFTSTDVVNYGSGAVLDGIAANAGTILVWVFPDAVPAAVAGTFVRKDQGNFVFNMGGNGVTANLQMNIARGTQSLLALCVYTNVPTYGANKWCCVATTYDCAGANGDQQLWHGDLATPLAETTGYTTQRVGSGAVTDTSTLNLLVGNSVGATLPFDGKIAFIGIWNRRLSLAEMISQQYHPHVTSGCVLFNYLGIGNSTEADWSGNANQGTVTGTTLFPNVPRRPFYGGRAGWRGNFTVAGQTYTISPAGVLVPVGVLTKGALKGYTGAVASSGAIAKTTTKATAGSVASSGSTVRLTSKGLAGAFAPSGAITRTTSKTAAGSIAPAGNPANLTDKGLAGALVPTGLLARASSAIYAGVLVPVGSLSKAMAIAIGGALAPTGTLAKIRAVLLTFTGNLTPSGTLSRAVAAGIAGAMSPSGGVVKVVSATFRGAISPIGGLHKLIQKFWSGVLDFFGQLATLIGAAHVPSRLDVVGTYVPTIAVEVVYQQQLAVTGAYAPAISVTGEFDA